MGGTDDPTNLVELTVEEHAEAHRVLFETHGHEYDRIAWLALSGQINMSDAALLAQHEGEKQGAPLGGKITGRKNRESGHLANIFQMGLDKINSLPEEIKLENRKHGGQIQGQRNVENGWMSALGIETGKKNVESGHWAECTKKAAEAKRGKKRYYDPETNVNKFFFEGQQPKNWLSGMPKRVDRRN
jgi:hypothetical protein